jgi:hypothetical protein
MSARASGTLMGDWADLMLGGVVCEGCGIYLGDPVGYPRSCAGCVDGRAAAENARQSNSTDGVQPDDINDEDLPF